MNYSIDMIWINEKNIIVDIDKKVPPLKDKTRPVYYIPKAQAQYVLEVNAGFADAHKIKIGDSAVFLSLERKR